MKKVLLLSCLVLGGASLASASYELALIYDVSNRQILRYDPISNQALGSFGTGELGFYTNPNLLAQAANRPGSVLALDVLGVVREFDYSTGLPRSSVQLGANARFATSFKVLSNGNYLLTTENSRVPMVYNPTSGMLLSSFEAFTGYTSLDSLQLNDGTFASLERTVNGSNYDFHLFRRNSAGNFIGWSPTFSSSANSNAFRYLSTNNNQVTALGHDSFPRLTQFALSGSSYATVPFIFTVRAGLSVTPPMAAHSGRTFYFQNYSGANAELYVIDQVAGTMAYAKASPYSQTLGSSVMVVAPEPATLTALALGSLVLIRRRRRR